MHGAGERAIGKGPYLQDDLLRIRVSSAMYGGASCNPNMEAAQTDGRLGLAGHREPLSGKQNGG